MAEKEKIITTPAKTQFTALEQAIHDIRGLVHSVYYNSECLLEDWQELSEADRQFQLQSVAIASKRLREFSDNFLDLSKIKAGKMVFEFQKVDLLKLIDEVVTEYRTLDLHNSPLQLVVAATKFTKAVTYGNSLKLKQVLLNLLNNATKHCKEGTITIQLKKSKDDTNEVWHFSLSDQGCGIAENELQAIFEPFVQSQYTKKRGGTGLGLAICKEIITAHQGKIWAENNPDSGATLHFILPTLTSTSLSASNLHTEETEDTIFG